MIGWLLVLAFLLGFGLTWLYMVRSVTRTVEVISAPSRRDLQPVGAPAGTAEGVDEQHGATAHGSGSRRVVPQVIEFEEDTEEFYER